jgi:hypothetical protein
MTDVSYICHPERRRSCGDAKDLDFNSGETVAGIS